MRTPKTLYGRSPWLDDFPASRVPKYGRLKGSDRTDIAIVGGGLTGCATAYAFAAAGLRVVLIEQGQVGRGVTAMLPGWVTAEPVVPFVQVERALGKRAARDAFQAWRRSALDFGALVRRLDLQCRWQPRRRLAAARTMEAGVELAREVKARRAAGFDVRALSARAASSQAGLSATAGWATSEGARCDPYRAAVGLAAAAVSRGARVHEQSPVRKIRFSEKYVDVECATGAIRADRVVIATGMPGGLFKALDRHLSSRTTFAALTAPVPSARRGGVGLRGTLVSDSADPPHYLDWVDDVQMVVTGADTGAVPAPKLPGMLVQRTGQLMYELSTLYPDISGVSPARGWAIPYVRSADGLPILGPHRNYPRHLFAFGERSLGLTGAFLASRVLLRHATGDADRVDEVFGFARCLR